MIAHILMASAVAAAAQPGVWVYKDTAALGAGSGSAAITSADGASRLSVRCDTAGGRILSLQFIPGKTAGYSQGRVQLKIQKPDGTATDLPIALTWEQSPQGAFAQDTSGYDRIGAVAKMLSGGGARVVIAATNGAGMPFVQTFDTTAGDAAGGIARVAALCGGHESMDIATGTLLAPPVPSWVYDHIQVKDTELERAMLPSLERTARLRYVCDDIQETSLSFDPGYGLAPDPKVKLSLEGAEGAIVDGWTVAEGAAVLGDSDLIDLLAYYEAARGIKYTLAYTASNGTARTATFAAATADALIEVYDTCGLDLQDFAPPAPAAPQK